MTKEEILMHLAYGNYAGEEKTCGFKNAHTTEETATRAADSLNNSGKARHEVEAYPCYWCSEICQLCARNKNLDFITEFSWHIGRKMADKERAVFFEHGFIEMEIVKLGYAEPVFLKKGESGLKVHNRLLCGAEFCCIHNPSNHRMRSFEMLWRSDRGMMERICPHGIGHPDPDDMAFKRAAGIPDDGTHGCDGCCVKPVYPSDEELKSRCHIGSREYTTEEYVKAFGGN